MAAVNHTTEPTSISSRRIEPAVLGTACCLLSALCYTAANICLRQLAAIQIDPAWVICIKETVSVVVVGPWLLWRVARGERFHFPWTALVVLALAGLAVQLAGNLSIQWAFGVVGLAISMPLVFGVNLAASGLIGRAFFREMLSPRSIAAIILVILSIALLSVGAASKNTWSESLPAASGTLVVLLGIGAACLGGAMFATLGAAIRYAGQAKVPVAVNVVLVTGVGVIVMGAISVARLGFEGMRSTAPDALAWMFAAGVFNLLGFALIIKGLHLTTLVHANVLNASQVALGAIAGFLLFQESPNPLLQAGIALTIAGIFIFRPPVAKPEPD